MSTSNFAFALSVAPSCELTRSSLRGTHSVTHSLNRAYISRRRPVTEAPLKSSHPFWICTRCSALAEANGAGQPPKASIAEAIFKFTRPHTIRGTILAAFAGCARALLESSAYIDWALFPRAIIGLLALLLGNAFIVGINQIYDIRLDKINKPFLPLAAGEMKGSLAWGIVLSSAVLGLALVRVFFSRLIFGLYAFGMSFGALYSVPPFRFKRYPPLAAITISCVRGFLLNFGVYHATKSALGVPFAWSPPITFLAVFMTVFACVIALSKDLPDIKGDTIEGIPTFASRIGPSKMVNPACTAGGLPKICATLWASILSGMASSISAIDQTDEPRLDKSILRLHLETVLLRIYDLPIHMTICSK
ncbi:UbiA prenyltransferase [Gracilaria domingensis]|nr:UbiA prenyltransferase [Gracilaria domingensis]